MQPNRMFPANHSTLIVKVLQSDSEFFRCFRNKSKHKRLFTPWKCHFALLFAEEEKSNLNLWHVT